MYRDIDRIVLASNEIFVLLSNVSFYINLTCVIDIICVLTVIRFHFTDFAECTCLLGNAFFNKIDLLNILLVQAIIRDYK